MVPIKEIKKSKLTFFFLVHKKKWNMSLQQVSEPNLQKIPKILMYSNRQQFNSMNENVYNIQLDKSFPYLYDFDPMKRVHKMTCEQFLYYYRNEITTRKQDQSSKQTDKLIHQGTSGNRQKLMQERKKSTSKQTQQQQKKKKQTSQSTELDSDIVSLDYPFHPIYFLIGYEETYKADIETIINKIPSGYYNIQCFLIVENENDLVQIEQGQQYITYENLSQESTSSSPKSHSVVVEKKELPESSSSVQDSSLTEVSSINKGFENFLNLITARTRSCSLKDENGLSYLSTEVQYMITKGGIPLYTELFFSKYYDLPEFIQFSPQDESKNTMLLFIDRENDATEEGTSSIKYRNIGETYFNLKLKNEGNKNSSYIFNICTDIKFDVEQYQIPKRLKPMVFSLEVIPKLLIIFVLTNSSNRRNRPVCAASTYILKILESYQNYMNPRKTKSEKEISESLRLAASREGFISCINEFSVTFKDAFSNEALEKRKNPEYVGLVNTQATENIQNLNDKIQKTETLISTYDEESQHILKTKYSYAEYITNKIPT